MAETLNISSIRFYNLLKTKYGEKEAEEFISLLKDEANNVFESKKESLATKEDLHNLETKFLEKFAQLEVKIARVETRIILWAFVFWATQLGAIFAFLKLFIK
ncbi:MAG: hypothetical protein ACR2FN_13195 [Chitinophagaceae bacterium]